MKSNKLSFSMLFGFLFITILQAWYFYPKLPETVAYHFGPSGQADAWCTKTTFMVVDMGLTTLLIFIFIGLSRLPAKLPKDLMNIPNREYWLSPERKEETVQKAVHFVIWLAVLTLIFLRIFFHHIYYINTLGQPQRIQYFWFGFAIYIIAVGGLIWRFYRTFRIKVNYLSS